MGTIYEFFGDDAHSLEDFTICGLFITAPKKASGAIFVPGNSPFNTIEELVEHTA